MGLSGTWVQKKFCSGEKGEPVLYLRLRCVGDEVIVNSLV